MNVQVPPKRVEQNLRQDDQPGLLARLRPFLIGRRRLGCDSSAPTPTTHMIPAPAIAAVVWQGAPPVKVAAAHQREMPVIEKTIGTVVANSTVSVTARVQGQLNQGLFQGRPRWLKRANLLFQIDPAPFSGRLWTPPWPRWRAPKTNGRPFRGPCLKQNAIAPQTNDNNQAAYDQAKANAGSRAPQPAIH